MRRRRHDRQRRRRAGLDAVRQWEAEHGAFTAEEIAAARAELAAADSEQRQDRIKWWKQYGGGGGPDRDGNRT